MNPLFCWCPKCAYVARVAKLDVPKFDEARACPQCAFTEDYHLLESGNQVPFHHSKELPVYPSVEVTAWQSS